jgi:hypothetical protein
MVILMGIQPISDPLYSTAEENALNSSDTLELALVLRHLEIP